jgi:hypothetical protein
MSTVTHRVGVLTEGINGDTDRKMREEEDKK